MMIRSNDNRRRADFYRFLSRLYRAEVTPALLDTLSTLSFPAADGLLGEGYGMLKSYLDTRGETAVEDLAVDFATVFLAAGSADGSAAVPCESVYTSPKKIFLQEAWEDVRRIYGKQGLGKCGAEDLMEDHVAVELEFMAVLVQNADPAAQHAFLEGHLLNWLPAFTADIDRYARQAFYKAVGRITLGFLRGEQALLAALVSGEVTQSSAFSVRNERFANLLARLKERYRVFGPVKGPDGTGFGEIRALTHIAHRDFTPLSPEGLHGDDLLLICRPCHAGDLCGARRILLECAGCPNRASCTAADPDCAAVLRIDDICALVEVCDEALLPYFADEVPIRFTPDLP